MDRQIVYPGAIPLETDLLNTNKYAMTGLSKLASVLMGTATYLRGLVCTPSVPASMTIRVGPGEIYSQQNIDNTAYSSLAADTSDTILKQGVVTTTTEFPLKAPEMAGYSINYLIQAAYADQDSGATLLPYYNAAEPSVAFSGPGNSGTAQNTVRAGVCELVLKAGIAAKTGSQSTPSVDAGYIPAWVITVAHGTSAVTGANIAAADNAPFLPEGGLVTAIQQGSMTCATDSGESNTYVARIVPPPPAFSDGMRLAFKARKANTGPGTLSINGSAAYPIFSSVNTELLGGEIVSSGSVEVRWDSALTAWIMCGSAGGALPVAEATGPGHAINLRQADERYQAKGCGHFLPLTGGKLDGDLHINGSLDVLGEIRLGEAKLSDNGDITGKRWGQNQNDSGLLSEWIQREMKNALDCGEAGDYWWYKNKLSGLIFQGGKLSREDNRTSVMFPLTFPFACWGVQVTLTKTGHKSTYNPSIHSYSKREFTIFLGEQEKACFWWSIGK